MKKYILQRIGFGVLTLILMATLVFFLQNLIPSDPIPHAAASADADKAWRAAMQKAGLFDPIVSQFFRYIKHLLIDFTWGNLYGKGTGVWVTMTKPILYSVILTVPAFAISIFVGVPLGITAANYRGKWPDIVINVFAVTMMAIPAFAFVIYFSSWFHGIFPVQFRPYQLSNWGETLKSYTIPVICLSLGGLAPFVYYTRNEMVEVLKEDYIQTAQSKGLKWRTVLWKHAFRNGMIPVITLILSNFFILISGSFVIEGMFNIPGIAGQMISAVNNREVNQIMFVAIFFGGLNFVGQLLTDISYVLVDPRITYGSASNPSYYSRIRAFMIRQRERSAANNEEFDSELGGLHE